MTTPPTPVPALPIIRKITIERFRGIKHLIWTPSSGINVILGGGDVGKTTILDAIALLFSPSANTLLSDADYFGRNVAEGFSIEAVVTMPDHVEISTQPKLIWPWEWDGEQAIVVDMDSDGPTPDDPVYRVRVRGTDDLDLSYEIVQPNEEADHFNVSLRRAIGLVRLSGDDRNDRDLRLVHGSALERMLADKTLRSRLGMQLAKAPVADELKDDAKEALTKLDAAFAVKALPNDLDLGITSPQGLSLNALIGLTALKDEAQLPISSWGSGTRRLAALEIAALHHEEKPLVVVDEVERGLEPYRQRTIVRDLQGAGSQVFITTHSPVVLRAAGNATFWYLDAKGTLGSVAGGASAHRLRDPEAYFARLAIVAEGATEVGFLESLLQREISADLLDLGIVISDGGGNNDTLQILEALTQTGLQVAGFADNEGSDPTRWAKVKARLGDLLFQWQSGCIEGNLVPMIPDDQLEEFICPPDDASGERLRTLADRLSIQDKDLDSIAAAAAAANVDLRTLIVQASTGAIPDDVTLEKATRKAWKKHGERWFKNHEGGRELAEKVFRFGLWTPVEAQLRPFIDAVRSVVPVVAPPTGSDSNE